MKKYAIKRHFIEVVEKDNWNHRIQYPDLKNMTKVQHILKMWINLPEVRSGRFTLYFDGFSIDTITDSRKLTMEQIALFSRLSN